MSGNPETRFVPRLVDKRVSATSTKRTGRTRPCKANGWRSNRKDASALPFLTSWLEDGGTSSFNTKAARLGGLQSAHTFPKLLIDQS